MILTNLKLTNFKKYKTYEVAFSEGLIGILGKNGSGKSTLFEAIIYALYGESKQNKELIKNSNADAKDNVVVELEFELDNKSYKILRELRGKAQSANVLLYENSIDICSGAKECTKYIQSLTKMDKTAFSHTLFASQKELTTLSSMNKEDRKKMIRNLLGLEKIEKIEKNLKEKIKEINKTIKIYSGELLDDESIKTITDEIQGYTLQIQNSTKTLSDIQTTHQDIQKIEDSIKQELQTQIKLKESKISLANDIKIIDTKIVSNETNLQKATNELNELNLLKEKLKEYTNIKQEYTKIDEDIKTQNDIKNKFIRKNELEKIQTALRKDYGEKRDQKKHIEDTLADIPQLTEHKQDLQRQIATIETNIQQEETKQKNYESIISVANADIQKANIQINKLKELGKESACPVCTRPLLQEYDNVINMLQNSMIDKNKKVVNDTQEVINKIIEYKNSLNHNKSLIQNALQDVSNQLAIKEREQKIVKELTREMERIRNRGDENNKEIEELKDINYDENIHNSLIQKHTTLRVKYDEYISIETKLNSYNDISIYIEKQNIEKNTLIEDKNKKQKEYEAIIYDENIHKEIETNLANTQTQKENILNQINDIKISINDTQNRQKLQQFKIDENNKKKDKIKTIEQDLNDYQKIKINLDEFKTKINSQIVPQISQTASSLYYTITNGKYEAIEISEEFDFFIYDDGQKYTIDRFSGGEIDLANIVLRIAISKTLSNINGSRGVEFLAFDEVFGSQDEARRISLLNAFNTIKEQYRQIFLISHEVEIKEMFERVITL